MNPLVSHKRPLFRFCHHIIKNRQVQVLPVIFLVIPIFVPAADFSGLTEGSHCSVCGKTLVAQDTVDALGHTPVTDDAVAPNCTDTGLTEGSHCSVCGETDGEPLGHAWVDATELAPKTCSACGVTEGDPLPMVRHDLGMDYETFANTMNTALGILGYEMEFYGVSEEGLPTYYVNSTAGEELDIEVAFELMDDQKTVYSVAVATGNASDVAMATVTGMVGGVAMGIAEPTITQDVINSLGTVTPIETEGMLVYSIEYNGLIIMLMEGTGLLGFYICPMV